jgi:tRNA 5-methylaminomethyl-2-thiouridine biosynthesis bifunctional protein
MQPGAWGYAPASEPTVRQSQTWLVLVGKSPSPSWCIALLARLKDWQAQAGRQVQPAHLNLVLVLPPQSTLPRALRLWCDTTLPAFQSAFDAPLVPSLHRVSLARGTVTLTLCINTLHQALASFSLQATACLAWAGGDVFLPRLLARQLAPGARLTCFGDWTPEGDSGEQGSGVDALFARAFDAAGFVACAPDPYLEQEKDSPTGALPNRQYWHFKPDWSPAPRPSAWQAAPRDMAGQAAHAVVVGAGLAGACTAFALAQRGWRVTVLDTADKPATGASGLPAGIFCPQTDTHNPLAELTRIGVGHTLAWCQALLQHTEDYAATGVCQRHLRNGPNTNEGPDEWHVQAGWIKPARLVEACMQHPGIAFLPAHDLQSAVSEASPSGDGLVWRLRFESNLQASLQADLLVVATANHTPALMAKIAGAFAPPPLTPVAGQVSFGALGDQGFGDEASVGHPVNGWGHLLPHVPFEGVRHWVAGASYHRGQWAGQPQVEDTQATLAKVTQLVPLLTDFFKQPHVLSNTKEWVGTRCTTPDRLPLAGHWPMQAGVLTAPLIALVGLGSRGLTLAPLLAEMLADLASHEPAPLPKRLIKAVSPLRYIRI